MKAMYIILTKTCKILCYLCNICRLIVTYMLKKCWLQLPQDAEMIMPKRMSFVEDSTQE